MNFLNDQVRAILWAQFKGIYNKFSGSGSSSGRAIYWISSLVWYGGVCFLAFLAANGIPEISTTNTLATVIGTGLLVATIYWQFVPVMLATTGVSLDLRRLIVYPILPSKLFVIEVLLRVTTGVEVLLIIAGGAVGLIRSPIVPWWGALALVPFCAFNLLLSAGVRDLLTRLLARRGVREVVVFGFVLLSALPQLIVTFFPPEKWKGLYQQYGARVPDFPWPWRATAQLAAGGFAPLPFFALIAWVAAAAWFGYSQFQRGLRWDASEVISKERSTSSVRVLSLAEAFYQWPGRLLPDPLGILVEKEIRSLIRAPRFRLVFFMGFSFGLVIWLPMILGRNGSRGVFSENILVWVSLYAALLLGEVLFWNCFGFDRTATQAYYVMPVKLSTVLIAKNITAVFFLLLEVTIVTCVVLLLRLKFPLYKIPEAYAVTLLLCVFLLAMGNMASTHFPRPVDASQSWRRSSSGKVQGMLLLFYPILAIPVALSYLARYAFESHWAFYLVLSSAFIVASMTYWVSLDASVEAADKRREAILSALSSGEGPIS
jgi:ABC-2 type transport system permease protein